MCAIRSNTQQLLKKTEETNRRAEEILVRSAAFAAFALQRIARDSRLTRAADLQEKKRGAAAAGA